MDTGQHFRLDVAWAAGLFEGEGHIGRSGSRLRASLAMTDERPVRDFARILGVGGVYFQERRDDRHKPVYRWACGSFEDVQAVAAMLWPWLSDRRRDQIRHALDVPVHEHSPHLSLARQWYGRPLSELTPEQFNEYARRCYQRKGGRRPKNVQTAP